MNDFQIHTLETAPSASQPVLQGLADEVGFIPNLAATMAESPTLLETFTATRSILGGGTLSGAERETVSLAVSFENSCSYCMAAHSLFAQKQGAPQEVVAALRAGESCSGDPKLDALVEVTRQVVRKKGFLDAGDRRAFHEAGYTQAQLLEVLAVVSMTSLANLTHNVAHTAVDEAFQSCAWTPPAQARAAVQAA